MICGQCRHDNEPEAKFCSECGAPLAATCGSCGAAQPPGAKFCNQCGNPLQARVTITPGAPASIASTAVRKNVTALFADLVGSTAFGEQFDPEAARAALAPYFDILRSTVEDRAGTVVKFTGDGVLAMFGIPEVAEDDALRAVATGVDLQRRFGTFADQIRDRHGVELGLRIGINSGELVVADDDADLVGDVLNTAARLESECTPGRVLVGEDTWRLTRSTFRFEVLGDIRVKGKADPVASFQVVDDVAVAEETTPFVGRQAEMQLLLDAFDEARDSPVARLVTVIGAPGVGKTRLAQELRTKTEARSFDLRLERRGSTTFTPVAELLREVSNGTAEGVDRLFADHPERARLVPILQSFLGHGEARSTEESFWATRRLLEHLTDVYGPTILVVDDIQWAEPRFWDLLDHLVEWAEAPVLIVALARPELRELRPELAQPGRRVSAAIALEGLDATSTRELAARLLDTDDLPGELLEQIPDTTEGNPLFVRELIQMLVDDGTLARVGDRWRLTIDVEAVEVPPTVLSLLATRVERLPDDERQLVELASVIGTEFDRGTLAAIMPAGQTAGLGAVIDRLRRKDLIEPSGAWAGDHPVYRFHHVLVRDAGYRRLLKGRRAELHEAVGRHLDQVDAGGEDLDVTVAHHFEQVVRFRTELGNVDATTTQLAKVAAERLRGAAETALSREDLPSAGGYATRALDLVDTDDPARDELLVLACEALLSSGDVAGAAPFVRELHERSSDERLAAWADCFRAQRWSFTDADRLTEAADLTDDAATRLAALDDQAGVAKARLVRAGCLARLGRVGDCERELDLALGAARTAGDRRRTVAVLGAAPLAALWGPSPVARAGGRCLDVLRLLRITTASPAVEATSIRCQGMLEALRSRFDSAREKLEASRSTAKELGLRHGLFETELFAGFVELWADDPAAAEVHLRAAYEGLGRLGLGADAGQAGALLARALHRQGLVDEAEPLAQDAVDSAGQNLQTAMEARAILAEIRSLQGRHDEARELVDEALAIAERTDDVLDQALVALAASRIAAAAGDDGRSNRHRAIANRLLEDKGVILATPAGEPGHDASRHGSAQTGSTTLTLENTASRCGMEELARLKAGDREGFIALAGDDFVVGFHAGLDQTVWGSTTLSRSEIADLMLTYLQDVDELPVETIAIRGDDLCLLTSTPIDHERVRTWYHVVQTTDGRLSREDWFGADQLCDAVEFLDDQYQRSLGHEPVGRTVWDRLRRAMFAGDRAAAEACLADDFVVIDHRVGGLLGERSRTQFVETTMPGDAPWYVTISAEILRVEHGCALARGVALSDGVGWVALAVAVDRGGLATRLEYFDPTDLDAASARFDKLVRGQGPTLSNRAIRLTVRGVEALERGDRDEARSVMADDFFLELRLRIATEEQVDRDQFLDILAAMNEQGFPLTLEPLAVRGDDLALFRNRMVAEEGTTERVLFVESDDQSVKRMVSYDPDLLPTASTELDDRWVSRGGPSWLVDQSRAFTEALTSAEGLRDFLHDDAVVVDHRFPQARTQTVDEWLASTQGPMQSPTPLTDGLDIVVEEHVRHEQEPPRSVRRMRTIPRNGDPPWRECVLIAGERIQRFELFGADDLDTALRRYDELAEAEPAARSDTAIRPAAE